MNKANTRKIVEAIKFLDMLSYLGCPYRENKLLLLLLLSFSLSQLLKIKLLQLVLAGPVMNCRLVHGVTCLHPTTARTDKPATYQPTNESS